MSFFMIRPWGGQIWHLFWNILKKNLPKKIWRIFWINLIFFPNFWHILSFFGVFGCIMTIRISRWNFPNFLSILGDFPTKFKFFDCFWLFLKFWSILGLNGYQDEISQIIFQFWGISKKIQYFQWFLINFDILGCIMTKWIQRLNFPNFPLILEDFLTK